MAEKEKPTLCGLPTEIQHLIVLNLHPSAAIALRQTNRWFHQHICLHRLDQHEVSIFLSERERSPKFCHGPQPGQRGGFLGYACFSCLCIKPATCFTQSQVVGHYAKERGSERGQFSDQRYCIDCGLQQKKFHPGQLLKMAGGAKPKAFCSACSGVQAYFCPKCRLCMACIASLKSWTARMGRTSGSGSEVGLWRPCPTH